MRNFNFKIPSDLDARLKTASKRSGAPMSEIIRRSVVEYLEQEERRYGKDGRRADAMAEAMA